MFIDHICPQCKVPFVHFKKNVLCPNCKYPSTQEFHEHLNFLPEVLKNMTIHKRKFGRYSPKNWEIKNVTDYVQKVCFEMFDHLEASKPLHPQIFLNRFANDIHWHKTYLKIHTRDIVSDLYEHYKIKKPRHTLLSGIKSLLNKATRM